MNSMTSGLVMYSIGIVKTDKLRSSDIINVIPIEELPLLHGDLINNKTVTMESNKPNKDGVVNNESLESDNYIQASWLPYSNSNRLTSPDVIKGETVILFRYQDTDEYYWTTIFREPSIRRLETVIYAYGDLKDGNVPLDKNTTYYMAVSTHDKYVKVHTSKSDGEPFEYDIMLDTANGTLNVNDNIGNNISLDSRTSTAAITTNLEVILNSAKVTINASSEIKMNTPIVRISNDVIIGGSTHTDGDVVIGGTSTTGGTATFLGGTIGDNIGRL